MPLNKNRLNAFALVLILAHTPIYSENIEHFSGTFDSCLQDIGAHLFSSPTQNETSQSVAFKVIHCELTKYVDSDKKISALKILLEQKNRFASFDENKRNACIHSWKNQWQSARDEISKKSSPASSVIDMELYYRASLEAAMTAAASVSTYAHNKGEYAKDCNNPFIYIPCQNGKYCFLYQPAFI